MITYRGVLVGLAIAVMVVFAACDEDSPTPTPTTIPPAATSTRTPAPPTPTVASVPTSTATAVPTPVPEAPDQESADAFVEIAVWGEDPATDGISFSFPNAIAVDSSDNIYTTEFSGNRVQKFTPDGVLI